LYLKLRYFNHNSLKIAPKKRPVLKELIFLYWSFEIDFSWIKAKNRNINSLAPIAVKILCGLEFSPQRLLRQFAIVRVQRIAGRYFLKMLNFSASKSNYNSA
jgi:hypothetical protein